jgi:polar amino acid transport system substrate-binding protein
MSTRAHAAGLGTALALVALALAATASGSPESPAYVKGCAKSTLALKTPGMLTLASAGTALRPWFSGSPAGEWRVSNPATGKGFEAALAYAIAKRLGFSKRQVTWLPLSAERATQPGSKAFDFYLGQVRYSPMRDRDVDFSSSYYLIPEALLSRSMFPVAGAKTIAQVRPAYIGVVVGTTGERYTVKHIRPNVGPLGYDSIDTALAALERGRQATGIVIDLPTAYALRARVPNGVIVGHFPNRGSRDRFAFVFEQGSSLRRCVNKALGLLHENGTVKKLKSTWLTPAGGQRLLR